MREEDTFGNQLERLLNEKAKSLASFRIYEVVNCGVSGFGTREERLFYQDFGVRYEPNIVLLVMVANDDMSFLKEVEKGYLLRRPGKFESLFYIWRKMQEYRHRRPFPDYRACIDEILQLNSEVLKQDARLAVVIFRDSDEPEAWDYMASSVTKGLEGTDITILDLGKALFEKYPDEDLRVHEIDHHPNEIAHKTAAEQILDFLQRKGLLQSFDALGMAEQ